MQQLRLRVPTYHGQPRRIASEREECREAAGQAGSSNVLDCQRSNRAQNEFLPDFGEPYVPVLIHECDGARIALGTPDTEVCALPDIQIERRPNGWMVFLHPLGGSDASGYVLFLDDGKCFLVKEVGHGPTPPIQVIEELEQLSELDQPRE